MNKNALEQNKSIVITGGTHVEGTVAIEKLLQSKALLSKIGKMLCDEKIDEDIEFQRHFGLQMLFSVKVDYTRNYSKATISDLDLVGKPVAFNREKTPWEHALNRFKMIHSI
jgi:hypothetical protein